MKSKSSYGRNSNTLASNATKKSQELKQSSTDKSRLSSHRNDAKHRRSPSVITIADQTTITNSVAHVAANDPSVKALVLQQQQREQHETEVARSRKEQTYIDHMNPSFVKYNTIETNSSVFENDHNDSEKNFTKVYPSSSPEPSTLLLSSQGQVVIGAQYLLNTTPGSNAETILVGHHNADDDGTNVSEITSDAGYMVVNSAVDLKILGPTPEIVINGITENIGILNINDIGPSLIHDQVHTLTPSNSNMETSISKMSLNHTTTNNNNNINNIRIYPDINGVTEKSDQNASAAVPSLDLLNPKELPNDVLQACYLRFLQEMEARGLYSIPPQNLNMPLERDSMIHNNNNYNEELSSIIDNCESLSRRNASQSMEFPISSFSFIGKSLPHELRKNVKRSKSGGSETAFISPVVVNANNNITTITHNSSINTGRRTPNSPYLQRFSNSNGDLLHSEKLNTSLEPEDIEIKNAFGTSPLHSHHISSNVYQSSPSNNPHSHSSYIGSGLLNTSSVYNTSNNIASSSPVLNNNSASPKQNTSASVSANTSTTVSPSAMMYSVQRRPLSRGSGVIPPLHDELIEMRRNCLSCLPTSYKATSSTSQSNDLSSKTNIKISQIDLKTPKFKKGSLHGAGPGFGAAALLRYNMNTSSSMIENENAILHETTSTTSSAIISRSNSSVNSNNPGQTSSSNKLTLQHSLPNISDDIAAIPSSNSILNINESEDMNKRDLVKWAGGFDQLLRRGRLHSKELVPDVNSAFDDCSIGSQSLRSVGSNRSVTSKKKKPVVVN